MEIVERPTRRITILVGGFGSGKTETAINLALRTARGGERCYLADLDLVTPFFRSREVGSVLEEAGVKVLFPPARFTQTDLPVLPPALHHAIRDRTARVILDVGGSEVGARAVAGFAESLAREEYDALCVVNPRRPFVMTADEVVRSLRGIELVSRLRITGLVANPHASGRTDWRVIRTGIHVVEEAARRLGLPIKFVCLHFERAVDKAPFEIAYPVLPLELYMRPPWDDLQSGR